MFQDIIVPPKPQINPEYKMEQLKDDINVEEKNIRQWLRGIERKKQAILYGVNFQIKIPKFITLN